MSKKTLPYAYKSGLILVDPRADAQHLADLVEATFELSETSEMPAFLLLRTRTGNLRGQVLRKDNIKPPVNTQQRIDGLSHARMRVPQPPRSLLQERLKYEQRLPAAQQFIVEHALNELFECPGSRFGIITHGMIHNTTVRALDVLGVSGVSLLCLNVLNPLVPKRVLGFFEDKTHVLIVEEGAPPFIEEQIRATWPRVRSGTRYKLVGPKAAPAY